jgi:hypothetical protein
MSAGEGTQGTPSMRLRLIPWRIERPVFIIAPPRSGSTLLFECLARFPELRTFTDREGTYLWRWVIPYALRAQTSDHISPEEFGSVRRAQLKTLLYARSLVKDQRVSPAEQLARFFREPRMRYLDKTIANTFRQPLIAEMFPEAAFIHLVRNPHDNIASMIEGWSFHKFQKPKLQRYLDEAGSALPAWTYAAPPGWRDVLDRSVPEACAWSWRRHIEAILDWRDQTPAPGPIIRYEDLVSDTVGVIRGLASHLGLEVTPEIEEVLVNPPRSRTTLPRASAERRALVAEQVEKVLPTVAATAIRIGY